MKNCSNYEKNMKICNCTYEPCPRKGHCCECMAYASEDGRTPGLLFPE